MHQPRKKCKKIKSEALAAERDDLDFGEKRKKWRPCHNKMKKEEKESESYAGSQPSIAKD